MGRVWRKSGGATGATGAAGATGATGAAGATGATGAAGLDAQAVVGVILPHAAASGAAGYLKCNGAVISRTAYAALFAVIGTVWGAGDGSSTFNVPDFRGEFLRGADDGSGVDSGRVFASSQGDAYRSHSHAGMRWGVGATLNNYAGASYMSKGGPTGVSGGAETRPRNIALHYWIKF